LIGEFAYQALVNLLGLVALAALLVTLGEVLEGCCRDLPVRLLMTHRNRLELFDCRRQIPVDEYRVHRGAQFAFSLVTLLTSGNTELPSEYHSRTQDDYRFHRSSSCGAE
jgi:hypothetical protein